MKKIFLPLLAVVGMIAGFTLCSCGGGGGSSSDGPARAIANCKVELLSSPVLEIQFGDAATGWVLNATVTAGLDSPMPAYFSITKQPTLENGCWRFWGNVNFVSATTFSRSDEFRSFLGIPQEAASVTLESFQFYMDIPDDFSGSGTVAGRGATAVVGHYYGRDDSTGEGEPILADPVDRSFIFTGSLKTQHLGSGSASTEGGEDDKWK